MSCDRLARFHNLSGNADEYIVTADDLNCDFDTDAAAKCQWRNMESDEGVGGSALRYSLASRTSNRPWGPLHPPGRAPPAQGNVFAVAGVVGTTPPPKMATFVSAPIKCLEESLSVAFEWVLL